MTPEPPAHLPIAEWLYVNTGLIWATRREIEEPSLDAVYSADNQVITWLVKEGEVTMKTPAGSAVAGQGDWMFPGSRKGRQTFRPGSVVLSLRFFAEWPTGKALFDHRDVIVFPAKADPQLTRAAEALESLVRRVAGRNGFFLLTQGTADVESYFAIRCAFEKWMLAYVRRMLALGNTPSVMSSTDPQVLRAARLIDNRTLREPLREAEIARGAGLSVSQLNRLFTRDLGMSPKKYLQRRRLQSAILLLQNQRRSIKEAAYELGFGSISNFSNWFFRQKGVYPKAFLKGQTGAD